MITDTLAFTPFLFQSTAGHRLFIQPRGTYRYEGRASLDLHLERSFARGQNELLVTVDGFNVLGDASVTGIQIDVSRDYGRVRSRVAVIDVPAALSRYTPRRRRSIAVARPRHAALRRVRAKR